MAGEKLALKAGRVAAINACRSMFGCGNGGVDLDEPLDPTEAVSALSESEKTESRYGMLTPDILSQLCDIEDGVTEMPFKGERKRGTSTPHQKTIRKKRQKKNKMHRIKSWRSK